MKKSFILINLLLLSILLSCNNNESSDESFDELYQIFEIIKKEWPDEVIQEFKSMDEEKAVLKHYRNYEEMSIGIWLRNNYLKKGSSLYLFFNSHGIFREDASAIILTSFHRKLNNKPINFYEQKYSCLHYYYKHRNDIEEKKKK